MQKENCRDAEDDGGTERNCGYWARWNLNGYLLNVANSEEKTAGNHCGTNIHGIASHSWTEKLTGHVMSVSVAVWCSTCCA